MAEQVKTVTHGLVLRETETKESDKILTVLTPELGRRRREKSPSSPGGRGGRTAVWRRRVSSSSGPR